jgi:putative phage-type endonuclease
MSAIVVASTENMDYVDWLNWRRKGIGGSDASVVCGISRYKSPVELWMDKTGQLPYDDAGEAAYWGAQLEALVKAEFSKRTGIEVKLLNQLLQNEDYPFMIANLDGVCEHPDYGTCVFEAKTASAYKAGEWSDAIPDEYMLQVQHYLAVTGYKGAYIAALIGGNTFKWKFIERDDDLIAMLIKLEAEFWRCVQTNTPPPLDGTEASSKFICERFPSSIPQSKIELPETAGELIRKYESACEQLDFYTEQKQEAENQLKQMLGEHEVGITGDRMITWKSVSQERLDTKSLKVEYPNLYKKFATTTSYRRFSVRAVM